MADPLYREERPLWSSGRCAVVFLMALGLYVTATVAGAAWIQLRPTLEAAVVADGAGWRCEAASEAVLDTVVLLPPAAPPLRIRLDEERRLIDPPDHLGALLAAEPAVSVRAVTAERLSLARYLLHELR